MANPRESRFLGNGNAWVADGRYRGWRVQCSSCPESKVVSSHSNRSLPPNVLVKRFTIAGWHVGRNERGDLCPNCQKTVKREPPTDDKATRELLALTTAWDLARETVRQSFLAKIGGSAPPVTTAPSEFEAWLDSVHKEGQANG